MSIDQAEILRTAERAVMDLVIELHFLAGHVSDPAIATHIRRAADALNDMALELRALADAM